MDTDMIVSYLQTLDRLFEDYISHRPDQFDVYFGWADLYNPELQSVAEDKEKSI